MRKMVDRPRDKKDEHVEVLDNSPIEERPLPPIAEQSNQVEGSALDRPARSRRRSNAAAVEDEEFVPPTPHCFRVLKGGPILSNGFRSFLKPGKEIDDLNYDIRALRSQGIQLEEIDVKTGERF